MIAHVFVDAENIPPSVTFKVVEHFGREHTITRVDIIAKEDTLPARYRGLDEKIYRVQNCFYGKNSADTWLCIEMVRAIIDEPELELIIIISSDKDFLPAIKFAVDFEKKILIVSNGASHRTLIEQLKILHVEPSMVELIDFRLKFGDRYQKLGKFLPRLSFYTKKYFLDREERVKFILVKSGEKISEVPIVEGMGLATFGRLLRELGIISYKTPLKDFIADNFLKLWRDRIYLCNENEIWEPTPAEQIEQYFEEHAAEACKVSIKHNGKLTEIQFVDGMSLEMFGRILRERKIIGKSASPAQVAEKSLLKVEGGKVYLRDENDRLTAYGNTIDDVDEYLRFHGTAVKQVLIKHSGKIYEVPFVDGITLELFGKILRGRNIIGKSATATSIAKKNYLDVRDGKIYLCDEERLSELYAESTGDLAAYFYENDARTIKIFVKHNGNISEIPFVNGMPLTLFEKTLRDRKIIGKNSSAVRVAAQSLLDVRGERIYLYDEAALENIQNDSLLNVDDYFNEHALEICSIDISRGGESFSIPFVDGMPLEMFGKLLRERKIIGASTPLEEVIAGNSLKIRDEKIFVDKEGIYV